MTAQVTVSKIVNVQKTIIFSVTTLIIAGQPVVTGATVFRWTDDRGQTHYGDRPPQTHESEGIVIRDHPGQKADSAGLRPDERVRLREIAGRQRLKDRQAERSRSKPSDKRSQHRARCSEERRQMKSARGRDSFKQHARYLRDHCW